MSHEGLELFEEARVDLLNVSLCVIHGIKQLQIGVNTSKKRNLVSP